MTIPDNSQTIETYEIEDLSLSGNIPGGWREAPPPFFATFVSCLEG